MTDEENLHIELGREFCDTQGKIFVQAGKEGYSFPGFVYAYLTSKFCAQYMDKPWSRYHLEDEETCMEQIRPQMVEQRETAQTPEYAYWLGYTYRQLSLETGIPSARLLEKVPPEKLIQNYAAHHTMDETYSSDDLCQYFKIEKNDLYRRYSAELL